jgi:uncharacterized membrane protein YtjA (UPF0391 family)
MEGMGEPQVWPGKCTIVVRSEVFLSPEVTMLRWAVVFLVIALIAAVFGFGGVAGDAAWIAKILFFLFLVVFVVSLLVGRRGRSLT